MNNSYFTVVLTVSGGKSSAYQAIWCTNNKDIIADYFKVPVASIRFMYLFCNTGRENNATLDFVDYLDREFFNNQVVWLEAVIDIRKGKGTRHRVTNYRDAHRADEYRTREETHPFMQFIRKFGTPNQDYKSCTRDLKVRPQESYMRSLGYKTGEVTRNYWTAIGYRTDEAKNRRPTDKASYIERKFYPMLDLNPSDKVDVDMYWEEYDHPLTIPSYRGNCETCFKKSLNKLNMVYIEDPSLFEFNQYIQDKYQFTGPEFEKGEQSATEPRKQFREMRNTEQLIAMFKPTSEISTLKRFIRDTPGGCDEECTGF